jgi:hypothetical protein
MKCSRCNRQMQTAAVANGNVTLGPRCARIMGIAVGKRESAPVVLPGQIPLFVPEMRPAI